MARRIPIRNPREHTAPKPKGKPSLSPSPPAARPRPSSQPPTRYTAPIPVGWVVISSPSGYLTFLLGDGPVKVTDGYGGWQAVPRARRKAVTAWTGTNPMAMTVPVIVGGSLDGGSIDIWVRTLETWGLPSDNNPTPQLAVQGPGIPHTDKTWVIDNLDWGDSEFAAGGVRVRQAITVSLLEFVDDQHLIDLKKPGAKKVDCNKARAKTKHYRVKKGDTLQSIAARQLGSANCWGKIAALNKIRDPKKIKVNQTLKLP